MLGRTGGHMRKHPTLELTEKESFQQGEYKKGKRKNGTKTDVLKRKNKGLAIQKTQKKRRRDAPRYKNRREAGLE